MPTLFAHAARRAALLAALAALAAPAQAVLVTLDGPLFDIAYENSGFIFQTGESYNPETMSFEPVFEQLGGFSIVAPNRVRYSLRPQEVFFDSTTASATIVPGGQVEVGGSALSSDAASDAQSFDLLPGAGLQVLSVQMLAAGTFDNGTDSATLTYSESVAAAGASDGLALSLGVFSSGALPSGSTAAFAARNAPFGVNFGFALDGVSSDTFVISGANVAYVDFLVTAVPEPHTGLLLLAGLAGLGVAGRRRSAGTRAGQG